MENKKIKDLTGHRFGMLTAVRRLDEKSGTSYKWLCLCDCGREVSVSAGNLKQGVTRSCGCLRKKAGGSRSRDLTGMRFGKLVAVAPTELRADNGSVVWRCLCDCGTETEVSCARLERGKVKSCGCLSAVTIKDWVGKQFGRLTVEAYAGKRNVPGEHFWSCVCSCGQRTEVGQNELLRGDTVSCGCYQKEVVRSNLILMDGTSVALLSRGKAKLRTSNKSGHTGVCRNKNGRWIAYINFKKKRYWLGSFASKEEAIAARAEGEAMHDDFLSRYYTEKSEKNDRMTDGFRQNAGCDLRRMNEALLLAEQAPKT